MQKKQSIQKDRQADRNRRREELMRYGRPILTSEEYRLAGMESHHLHGTVSEHTLTVCTVSLRICDALKKAGIEVNKKDVIEAALCHDLGMVGREERYKNRLDAWKSHPQRSKEIANRLVPDLSENAQDMILTHMWPVAGRHPHSREALILNLADKAASFEEWQRYLSSLVRSFVK